MLQLCLSRFNHYRYWLWHFVITKHRFRCSHIIWFENASLEVISIYTWLTTDIHMRLLQNFGDVTSFDRVTWFYDISGFKIEIWPFKVRSKGTVGTSCCCSCKGSNIKSHYLAVLVLVHYCSLVTTRYWTKYVNVKHWLTELAPLLTKTLHSSLKSWASYKLSCNFDIKQEVQGPWRSAWHLPLVWQLAIFCRLTILKTHEI